MFLFLAYISLFTGNCLADDSIPIPDTFPEDLFLIDEPVIEAESFHQALKTKFIEGSVIFMSIIALMLIAGLAFCLERIIYLNLSQINTKAFLSEIEGKLRENDLEGAKEMCLNTRGPVASICYEALMHEEEDIDYIDKSIVSCGGVQTSLLEKNLSWITLFIAAAPSFGFLGTVLGMIQAFDKIQAFGDINPSIVAGGMKFALITTVAGLIVALVLQFFYNYILNKIEAITGQMEDNSMKILDIVVQYKKRKGNSNLRS